MGAKIFQQSKGKGKPWSIRINKTITVIENGEEVKKVFRRTKKIGDKKTAEKVARKIEAKLRDKDFGFMQETQVPTFGEYAKVYLRYIKAIRRRSTHERYLGLMKHIPSSIQNKPLDQITRGEVRDLLLDKIQDYSRSTVCLIRDVLSGVFGYAIDEEIVSNNPIQGITKRLGLDKKKGKEINPFSQDELDLFLDTCQTHYPEWHAFFFMAARTGMRLGELLALKWSRIDFNSQFIIIKRSYRRGVTERPKNSKNRRIDMSDQLKAVLKDLLHYRKKEALKNGWGEPHDLVFHRESGAQIEQNYVRRVLDRILKKAGLRKVRFHDFRHTFVSLLLNRGESLLYIKEQSGHSSIQILVDIYGHLIPGENKGGVNVLDDNVQEKKEKRR